MTRRRSTDQVRKARHRLESELLDELRSVRAPLLEEADRLRSTGGNREWREHLCCRRPRNQMRISPLEARAIAEAFRTVPELRGRLPQVLDGITRELAALEDNSERQSFDCPLLDGTRCLVHRHAKPIGCLAWNVGRDYSKTEWRAFETRDELSDALHGRNWQFRVIPLWLRRVFRRQLARRQRASGAVEHQARPDAKAKSKSNTNTEPTGGRASSRPPRPSGGGKRPRPAATPPKRRPRRPR